LCYFWDRRGFVTEGLSWIKVALEHAKMSLDLKERSKPAYLAVMAKALAAEAVLAYDHGDTQDAQISAELSTSLARQVGDERTLAWSLSVGAKAIYLLGDVTLARAWAKEALNLSRQQEYPFELGLALSALQMSADPEYLVELNALCTETLPVLHKRGNPWVLALNTFDAASVADMSGNFIEAQARFDEAARLFHSMGDRQYYTACRSMLAHSLRRQARYSEALAIYSHTIQLWVDLGHLSAVAHELECIGFIAVDQGENQRAGVLFGAAQGIRLQINSPMSSQERNEYEQVLARLRLQADPADFNKSWSEGKLLTIEQAIEFTLL
jgi:tetratricopeptide (TPR) repeat protein